MILNRPQDIKAENKVSLGYWEITIDWTDQFKSFPTVLASSPNSCYGNVWDLIAWISGLDISQRDKLGLTESQILSTWKAKMCTVIYPNDPKACGINGNTMSFNWM